ncbi:MinD/ParA family protein [Oceanobacillus piezotolerans]|uniref:MinD/ParA family protein n=1 Tax=Oceanobacillus piezotolerans TaxID=2448030 RepID=A0A498DEC8_9BACI|nr:MinD/ParA family protein [Oceanobacillus piezotolerans]RLL45334.1 MinD/ParA family protein [Oceanobacillus piezotolerans]
MLNDQAASLRRAMNGNTSSNEAKTLCVISGKGGVGKSNFAINFSLELINNGKKVLLFDLDVGMGNIDILLGVHAKKTIYDMFQEKLPIHDIIEVGPKNFAYIAGGSGLQGFFSMDEENKNFFIEQYTKLVNQYDFIIFDMGAGVQNDSMFFILAADECIVVTTPEPTSITDAYSMIKHVIVNGGKMPIHVIMNRSHSKKSGEQALERFKQVIYRFLEIEIKKLGILPEDKVVSQSVIKQTPYLLYNERASVSKALRQLTSYYLNQMESLNSIQPATFLSKLKHFISK